MCITGCVLELRAKLITPEDRITIWLKLLPQTDQVGNFIVAHFFNRLTHSLRRPNVRAAFFVWWLMFYFSPFVMAKSYDNLEPIKNEYIAFETHDSLVAQVLSHEGLNLTYKLTGAEKAAGLHRQSIAHIEGSRHRDLNDASIELSIIENRTALGPFHQFWSNTADSFSDDRLWYHGVAAGSTYVLARSGADRKIQDVFQEDPVGRAYGFGALVLGGVWQPLIGGILYYNIDTEISTAGSAVLQAAVLNFAITSVLKFTTWRPDPLEDGDPLNKEDGFCGNSSDATIFFDVGGGCVWPSGHSASAVSLVSSLYAFYPEEQWIAYIGYPIAAIIGMGMVESDEHWFSDVVAGALIGHAIGWTIGKNFRRDFDQLNSPMGSHYPTYRHSFQPFVLPSGAGLAYQFRF